MSIHPRKVNCVIFLNHKIVISIEGPSKENCKNIAEAINMALQRIIDEGEVYWPNCIVEVLHDDDIFEEEELQLLTRLANCDWQQAFEVSNKPQRAAPSFTESTTTISLKDFTRKDVERILHISDGADGERDSYPWVAVMKLKDGRYASVVAGCDYTGWDCQSSGRKYVAVTYDEIMRFGIDEEERKRLTNSDFKLQE